jgi:hypothetical protein
MTANRFDSLTRTLATTGTRRGLLGAFLAGVLVTLRIHPAAADDSDAVIGDTSDIVSTDDSGIVIVDASGGDANLAGVVDPATSGDGSDQGDDNDKDQPSDQGGSCVEPETCAANSDCCSGICTCGNNPEAGVCQGPFYQDFSNTADGWNGVSASGGEGLVSSGEFTAFTRWGGYGNVFPVGGYTTSLDIYLDLDSGAGNDTRCDWSSAVNGPDCAHRRDFVFNVGYYNDDGACPGSGPRFVISASTNAGRGGANPCDPGRDPIVISVSGWYTFTHQFMNDGGVLVVALAVDGPGGGGGWTLSDGNDIIGDTVGGNRYGAFATQEFPVLAIDNSARM